MARNCADIDPDFGMVRNRIYVRAAVHAANVECRLAEPFMSLSVEIEVLQLRDQLDTAKNCVDAELGHRAVGRLAETARNKPQGTLMSGTRCVAGRLTDDNRADGPEST